MPWRTLLSTVLLTLPAVAPAQVVPYQPEEQVHWAVAAFFGTGWYRVDENRKAFIFRIPPKQVLRESGWHDNGDRKLGVEIEYPVALGLHQLDDLPDFIEFDNYGTISFTPGVRVEIPVSERWSLRRSTKKHLHPPSSGRFPVAPPSSVRVRPPTAV